MRKVRTQPTFFTLLEMVIALAILAVLVTILAAGGGQAFETWRRLTGEQAKFAELLALDRTADNMFRNIIPFTWPDETNKQMPAFFGEANRVHFAYHHIPNNMEDGALRFGGLQVEDGQLIAAYQERPGFEWDAKSATNVRTSVLASDVDSVEFWYADWDVAGKKLKWKNTWGKKDDPTPRMEVPLAILMIVKKKDGDENAWLRRTAGNSQYARFGRWIPRAEDGQ